MCLITPMSCFEHSVALQIPHIRQAHPNCYAHIMRLCWLLLLGLACASTAYEYTLDMNCTELNIVGSACMNYMREYISDYVLVAKKYNPQTLPVLQPYWHITPPAANATVDPVSVKVQLTLKNLVEVDTSGGSVTAAIFLDMYWRDQLLSWDPQWTDGYDFFDIDYTLLWTPDLQLYNVVGSYKDQINTPALFLSSNGDAWWDAQGLISFSCMYDTSKFPFDSQECSATFGSWIYASYQMNISETVVNVENTFTNLAWEVTDVTAATSQSIQWNVYPYSFSTYTIKVKRYYNHYVSTAIVPSLLVTYLTLLSLWIPDVNTRLSMGITGLLALVAVQWTVSSELPVSVKETWLGQLSNICVCYTAMVCLQGFMIGSLQAGRDSAKDPGICSAEHSGVIGGGNSATTCNTGCDCGSTNGKSGRELPSWVIAVIWLDDKHKQFATNTVRTCSILLYKCTTYWAPTKRITGNVSTQNAVHNNMHKNAVNISQSGAITNESAQGTTGTDVDIEGGIPLSHMSQQLPITGTVDISFDNTVRNSMRSSERTSSYRQDTTNGGYTWSAGTAALDHLTRIWLPLSFTAILIVFFADASA